MKALEGRHADVVVGSRFSRPEGMHRYRWIGTRVLDIATQVKVRRRIPDTQSGFWKYSRRAIQGLDAVECGMVGNAEALVRAHQVGMKIFEVPVTMSYSEACQRNAAIHGLGGL